MVKKIQYLIVFPLLVLLFGGFRPFANPPLISIKTIVIDPGHGGKDPGCHGVTHKEKDVALAVALKLGKYLEENLKDVKVIYTRKTDVFVELEDRAQIANKAKADLFISIHCNAAGKAVIVTDKKTGKKRKKMIRNKKGKLVPVETINPIPFGTETYVMGLKNEEGKMRVATRENSAILLEDDYEKKYGGFDPESEESYIIMSNYTSAYVIQSAGLAVKIQEEYTRKAGRIDKGVHRQSIWVLWRTSMPSILTEIGYLTNPLEETFLGSEQGQEYLAKALFRGIRRYKDELEGNKKEYKDEFENQVPLENENVKAGNIPGQKTNEEDELGEGTNESKNDSLVKEEPKPEIKPTPEEKPETKKETVSDKKYADITLKKSDSLAALRKKDSAISAKEIAAKFKKEEKARVIASNTKMPDTFFAVQIASSETPLNLSLDKYAAVTDTFTYRVNHLLKYTSGRFLKFNAAVSHQNFLREKGFKDCFVVAIKNRQRADLNEVKELLKGK